MIPTRALIGHAMETGYRPGADGRQQAAPQPAESEERLALETLVAYQSRGLPLAPPAAADPLQHAGLDRATDQHGEIGHMVQLGGGQGQVGLG